MPNIQEPPVRGFDDYIRIARRRRWWLILPLFAGWALFIVATWMIPPKYRSETMIIVEQQKISEQYVLPNITIDVQQRLQTMTQQILSRTRLLGIIESFHLYQADTKGADPDVLVQQMRKDISIDTVEAPGRPSELTAFKISYSAGSPSLAQEVTKRLSSFFVDENLKNRQELSESTTRFLESQLEQASKNLADQEARLRDFKAKFLGQLPEQLQTNIQILSGLQARLQAATEALDQANQQKLYLESLLSQYKALRSELSVRRADATMSPSALDQQLERLKEQLADLSTRYTQNHPDVARLKQEIEQTERIKEKISAEIQLAKSDQAAADRNEPSSVAELQAISPMLQIEGQVKSNVLEIANRKEEINRLERQIDAYQVRLNLTPVREQQLSAITRDHEQSRTNYESLLNKKLQSQMATNLEKRQEGEQFQIIDPPNFPQKPYSPDRFKFSLIGLVFGIFLGIASTTLVEMLDGQIHSEEDLLTVTPAPILITIPLIQSLGEQQRQVWSQWLQLAAALLLIAAIPAVTLISYYKG